MASVLLLLLKKLITQGHVTARTDVRRGATFHLFSRIVYHRMDKDNLRNRKRHSFDFIRTRLVLFDFILANQDLTYFETEQDKVSFFCKQLGLSQDCLPAKVYEGSAPGQKTIRYFIDKFPLFVAAPFPGTPPVVTFSYVDSGFERPSSFASHLSAYQPLFRQLDSFRFLYIAAKEAYFCGAEERFRFLVKRPLESDASNEILRYFQIRKKWDNHEYIIPVTTDLEFLRDARERFQGEKIENLYRSRRSEGLSAPELRAQVSQERPERTILFDTYLVNTYRPPFAGDACQSDGCTKNPNHRVRHGSRHSAGDAKFLGV
jgi:hypothetical protein